MKLFVIYLGGSTKTSLIELHDIRFVIASTIEETYTTLRNTWWGTPDSLHLDAWGELTYADGYDVSIQSNGNSTQENPELQHYTHLKLFFLNLGGYDSTKFTELHHNVFIVAPDKESAKKKAKQQISHWEVPHTDSNLQVENVISVSEQILPSNHQILLSKTDIAKDFSFICKYTPIAKNTD